MFNFNFMQKNYQLLLIIIINYNYRNSQKNRICTCNADNLYQFLENADNSKFEEEVMTLFTRST